jgi:glycosyltransferase involved in cell wall biosynthesis
VNAAALAMRPPAVAGEGALRIAQIAPLAEAVPPQRYGGTERIVAYLSEALAALGHEVTLFASADSTAAVARVDGCPRALRTDPEACDPELWKVLQLRALLDGCARFDIVHFHSGHLHFLVGERLPPHLTTLHGRLDRDPPAFYARFPAPLASISAAQRAPLANANWAGTVHHGLPRDLLEAGPGDGGYLAFVGRLSREKRVDSAIEIARRAGLPLKIIAKIDDADAAYVEREVRPLLDAPGVEFHGECDERTKGALLGRAAALLFPIDWPEPFGLVMIEALACATPVIAFRHGSVPEIIEDGRTGFVVESVAEAAAAVRRLDTLDRAACRAAFEHRFTAERMARDYVRIYRDLLAGAPARRAATALQETTPWPHPP